MINEILEHDIQNEIRIWCGEHNIMCIRINTGKGYTPDGRRFSTGVPNGWPDLMCFRDKGQMFFIETKAEYGRLSADQKKLHKEFRDRGFIVIVPYSLEEFIEEVEKIL